MTRMRVGLMLLLLGFPLTACGGATPSTAAGAVGRVSGGHPQAHASPAGRPAQAASSCDVVPAFDAARFPDQPRIDNRFLPLLPGMHLVLDGYVVADDGRRHPHRIETTMTDVTKVIDGVRTAMGYETDVQDAELTESEIFFVAEDRDGTVWNLGQSPEVYDNGTITGAPRTWLAGVAGAHAGIAMPAAPQIGVTYQEGLSPQVNWHDCATVVGAGRRLCVAGGCYDDVLQTDEYAPLEKGDGHQEKYYAPGVGAIRSEPAGGVDPETVEISVLARLCAGDLARFRTLALAQDHRAYTEASAVYGGTPPPATSPASAC